MARKYRNPLIIEALCELQLEPNTQWDLTIPGLVYERLKDIFPERRQAKVVGIGLASGADTGAIQQQVWAADRMQFVRPDGKALVQVGPHFLSINHLKPYPSWEFFLPMITTAIGAYREVAGPSGISRVALRYINRFDFPLGSLELKDYFEFYPHVGPRFRQDYDTFLAGIQFSQEHARDILQIQMASVVPDQPSSKAMILDLEYYAQKPGSVPLDSVSEWIDTAHIRIEDAFEAAITDRLRTKLDEVTE